MSTKIYNGYKLKLTDLNKIQDFCIHARDLIRAKSKEIYKKEFLRSCVYELDRINNKRKKRKKNKSIVFDVYWNFLERTSKSRKEGIRDPQIDFDINWCIIPLKNEEYCLVTFYCEHREIIKVWESLPEIEEYGYWNNTDQPENVSDDEWNKREKDWDVLGYEPPACVGLCFEVHGKYDYPYYLMKDEISQEELDNICNDKNRGAMIKEVKLVDYYCKYIAKKEEVEEDKKNQTMEIYFDALDWAKKEENQETIGKILDKLVFPCYKIEELFEDGIKK